MITDPSVRALKMKQLIEAKAAFHSLLIGTSARVIVDQNGDRVEFTAANRQTLGAYIAQLEAELGCGTGFGRPAGPVMFTF